MRPFERRLHCRYHTQDDASSCGPAITMMMLRHLEVPYCSLRQPNLLEQLFMTPPPESVDTTPEALSSLLNEHAKPHVFRPEVGQSTADLNRRLVHSIVFCHQAVAVAVTESVHWVLVEGIQTDRKPRRDRPCLLRGVWIHNPVINGGRKPPPHTDRDDCGAGLQTLGVRKELVTARQWVDAFEATDRSLIPELTRASVAVSCLPMVPPPELPLQAAGESPIDEARAVEIAKETFASFHLRRHVRAQGELRAGEAFGVLLSNRGSDQDPNALYYLVPWRDQKGIRAFSRIHRLGWLMSVGFTGRPVDAPLLQRGELRVALETRVAEIEGFRARLQTAAASRQVSPGQLLEQIATSARLVWKPSQQSMSPYFPVWEIASPPGPPFADVFGAGMAVNDAATSSIYLDPSGNFHNRLDEPRRG